MFGELSIAQCFEELNHVTRDTPTAPFTEIGCDSESFGMDYRKTFRTPLAAANTTDQR